MILALDVGTSSVRAAVFDRAGRPVAERHHRVACQASATPGGGLEHQAARLIEAIATSIDAVVAHHRGEAIEAVGIATFWHGLLGFDPRGHPITPIYMWGDTRSAEEALLLRDALDDDALHVRTGCHVHSSYWPAKLRWLARERPDEVRRVARWGSLGEALELELFGDAATSISMASGTGLLDQESLRWDPEALAAAEFEDDRQLFPLVDRTEPRRGLRTAWAHRWPALRSAAWFPAVGDGAASNVGSDCAEPDRVALNVGTSAALRIVTDAPPPPPRGLWRYRLDRRRSLLGGATSEGGNVYTWCRDVLRLPCDAEIEREIGALSPDSHGLTVLPFIAGERAPGWRGDRRALFAGIALDTGAFDILRAALEAVALRLALIYDLLAPHAARGHALVASGGALGRSPVWLTIIADALGHPITWSSEEEATSRGAALLALDALGLVPDLAALRTPMGPTVVPDSAHHARYREALARQRRLYERV